MNPLSTLFGAGVKLRNELYDARILRVQALARPVVSIGNISVGGSGKTPFVILLGELLKERGISFDVLSRGYGRRSTGVAVVDPNGAPEEFGDEPLLIARKLQVPVIVGAERYAGGVLAENKFNRQLHLLDDGFQHRRLHRDFNIVMLPASDLSDTLLPVGRLREPPSALRRADVVVTGSGGAGSTWSQEWRARREFLLDPPYARAVAFCALGRPQQFFDELKKLYGAELAATIAFRDHHRYTRSDVDRLLRAKKENRAEWFVTTEKDRVNLGGLAERLGPLKIAQLRLELERPQEAMEYLLRTLKERCGCKF